MSIVFGDIEPEDVFDPSGHPAPEQVARRLHEILSALRELSGGTPLPPWHLYSRAALEGAELAPVLAVLTLANAEDFGHQWYNARRGSLALPAWEALTEEDRELTRAIGDLIIAWLLAEGSLR